MSEPVVALVVAAGSGVRFGGQVPKALVDLDGRPLVWHSLQALAAGGAAAAVVVVAAGLEQTFTQALADAGIPVQVVPGGALRQDSVLAGLAAVAALPGVGAQAVVLVHDAARPLVPAEVVTGVVRAVRDGAAAVIPVVPVIDSIRGLGPEGVNQVVDRAQLRAVQTPQGFSLGQLSQAHQQLAQAGVEVTDDAAAVERLGHPVTLVDGSRDSLKVTEPIDLVLAEAILAQRAATGQQAGIVHRLAATELEGERE